MQVVDDVAEFRNGLSLDWLVAQRNMVLRKKGPDIVDAGNVVGPEWNVIGGEAGFNVGGMAANACCLRNRLSEMLSS